MRIGDYIGTYTGKNFYPLDPRTEDICLEDIAHALSQICRFNGHTTRSYDVANHSCNVQRLVQEWGYSSEVQLYALLHDAHEAYTGDFTRPLKNCIPGSLTDIEFNIQRAIYRRFGLVEPFAQMEFVIKDADNYVLALEARELMTGSDKWTLVETNSEDKLWYTKPFTTAEALFTAKFNDLIREAKRR